MLPPVSEVAFGKTIDAKFTNLLSVDREDPELEMPAAGSGALLVEITAPVTEERLSSRIIQPAATFVKDPFGEEA
jgi:hypothetical protein